MRARPQRRRAVSARSARPNNRLWRAYPWLIWGFAIGSAIGWSKGFSTIDWAVVVPLIVLGNVADVFAVRIQQGMRVSTAHFVAPFAIIASSPAAGLVAAVGCLLGRLIFNRRDWNTFDVAVNVSSASFAGVIWAMSVALHAEDSVPAHVAVVMGFAGFRMLINYGWTLEARSKGIPIPSVAGAIGRLMVACAILFTPAVSLYIQAEPTASHWWSALVLLGLPFVAMQVLVRSFGRERDLIDSLEDSNTSVTETLVNALDARDPYSAGHSIAVAVYARDIAVELGLAPTRVQRIYLAGLLHDIGKIAVPDAVLRKPAALTDEEFEEIKKHPVVGEQILAPSAHLADLLPAVRNHHERIDGKGYPDGLKGDDIPLDARIIAVADAYNAMTSERPYRDAMHPELACRILRQNQGMQHDPFLVDAFIRVLDANSHDYAVAKGDRFVASHMLDDLVSTRALREDFQPLRLVNSADDADSDGDGAQPTSEAA